MFVYFFYVETKGPTLEEIARIFDGEDAIAHVDLHEVEKDINHRVSLDAEKGGVQHNSREL